MIEVIVTKEELKGIQGEDIYIQNKLRHAGIPITGFFSFNEHLSRGSLIKEQLTDDILKYIWSE